MSTYPRRDPNRRPTHPGVILGTAIAAIGRTKKEISEMIGISRQHLNGIIGGRKPMTPYVAVRVGKLVGNGPGLWLRMQASHDAWQEARDAADDLRRIPTLRAERPQPAAA